MDDQPTLPQRSGPQRSGLPRLSLAFVCVPTAAVLGYGAWVLPWVRMTAFSIGTALLAALHLGVVVVALARPALLRRPLRMLGLASLAYLAWIAQQVFGSALYVAEIYGSLGKGVAAGLGAFVALTALLTLPVGLWALAVTAPAPPARSLLAWLLGGAAVFLAASGMVWNQGRAVALSAPAAPATTASQLAAALPPLEGLPQAHGKRRALLVRDPITCKRAPAPGGASAVVVYSDHQGAVRSACLQDDARVLPARIAGELRSHASRGPIKIDWLTAVDPLSSHPGLLGPLIDVLALRPGLDGVCHGSRCLMPWQMVALGHFAAREATPYIPKMRLGFAVGPVRDALGVGGERARVDGLVRITTHSLLVDAEGKLRTLRRLRDLEREPTAAMLARAERAAQAYVLRAQRRNGTYRYELDAYGGSAVDVNPSIPRHAGTTLVLCELGSDDPRVDSAIARALTAQRRYARFFDDQAALTFKRSDRHADLGSSALGLIAFTACRGRVGDTHDATIGALARFLIAMQRDDGSFRPGRDMRRRRSLEGPTPMFAAGQAIMALTQLEEILAQLPEDRRDAFPPAQRVHDAVELAMDHVAHVYWPSPLREFVYLKENWHCLAARAALRSHRHDGYERFCIDYARYKSRLVLQPGDDVDPEFVGGYGFGNIVPPHNGSSAGLGEALGASIALKRARGQDASHERAHLQAVLGFLVRQQLQPELCFACTSGAAAGWFAGYMVSPRGRIDHIQHPWSALGHGARALGLRDG